MSELATPSEGEAVEPTPDPVFSERTQRVFHPRNLWNRVSEVLLKAAEVMNDGGTHWTTNTLVEYDNAEAFGEAVEGELGVQRFCVTGGLNVASGLPQMYADSYRSFSSDNGYIVNEVVTENSVGEGGAGAEYAIITFDMIDQLYVLDTAKYALAAVLRGETVDRFFDPRNLSTQDAGSNEGEIIKFNDTGSGEIRAGNSVIHTDDRELRWHRIEAALRQAAQEAQNAAVYADSELAD